MKVGCWCCVLLLPKENNNAQQTIKVKKQVKVLDTMYDGNVSDLDTRQGMHLTSFNVKDRRTQKSQTEFAFSVGGHGQGW